MLLPNQLIPVVSTRRYRPVDGINSREDWNDAVCTFHERMEVSKRRYPEIISSKETKINDTALEQWEEKSTSTFIAVWRSEKADHVPKKPKG